MITGHGVMHGLPEPLDDIDPGAIGRLEQKPELRVFRQPALRHLTLVDHVVVEDEHDGPGPAIRATKVLEQLQEQRRGLSVMFDPDHPAGVSMQGAGDVVLLILPRSRDRGLFARLSGFPCVKGHSIESGRTRHGKTDTRRTTDQRLVAR